MNFEKQLYDSYHADPDLLQKNMNQENLVILCQLADQSENEITLQIVGSLVSTYIDQNHQQIVEFFKIFEFAWNRIRRFQTQSRPVYHFFSSIIANVILHFYDQLPVQYFKEQAKNTNKQVYLIIIDTVLRRLQPISSEFRIVDSKQKIVRQQFLKHNLDFILEIVISSFEQKQDLLLLDTAINLLNLLLETEIRQDHMEKDWHKLSRVEVRNRRNLSTIMKEIKYQILEQQVLEKMMQNSHVDHMDPVASHIKSVWTIVKHQQFIAKLTELLPLSLKIWESLGKICKVYQKFYSTDQQSIQIVQQITANIMMSDISKINVCSLLNFAGKTLFANHSPEWLEFNFNLIRQLSSIETVCVGLKFLRNFVRFQRQYDYSLLHQIMMPIIAGFFNQWVIANNAWLNDKMLRNNINHIIKEISCIMIEQYLDYFAQIMRSNVQLNVLEFAFKYYQMGLFASIQSTTYHLDVMNKLTYYKMDQFFFPVNQQLFQQMKYQELYSKALDFAFLYLNKNNQSRNKFYFKLWKRLFNQQALIKFEEILNKMQTERIIILNFNQIFAFEDQELVRKSLKVLADIKIRMEAQFYQINQINIPKECFSEFQQFRMIQNQKIITLYHQVKMALLNAQNESTSDQVITDLLVTEFKCQFQSFLDQLQDNMNVVFILQSMLNESARSFYGIVMLIIQDRGYLKQFQSAINFDLLKLTRMMISQSSHIGQLKLIMIDDLYEWILLVVQKVLQHLEQFNTQFIQERQLGQKSFQNIYKIYYKPLIMLLKIIQNLKHLNKVMTSKKQIRQDLYQQMLRIFKFINLNDLSTYMHKMPPLFYSIQWILEFETTRKLVNDEIFGIILDFLNCALLIQEKRTLSTALKIATDLQSYEQFRTYQYIQQRMLAENCLFGAFLYNIRISDISGIMLKYFQRMPNDFYTLFSKLKLRMQPYKSFEWDQLLNVKLDKLYQIIPKQCQIIKMSAKNSQLEKMFTDYFYQIQLFYNYYP